MAPSGPAVGAVVFLALLTALTALPSSPFSSGFFLVVAGTALSTRRPCRRWPSPCSPASVALIGTLDALDGRLSPRRWPDQLAAVALILLADIATAAARAQRHARDEALPASRYNSLTSLCDHPVLHHDDQDAALGDVGDDFSDCSCSTSTT